MATSFNAAFGGLATIDEDSMFSSFNFDDASAADFFKAAADPLTGLPGSSYDLFGSFEGGFSGNSSQLMQMPSQSSNASSGVTSAATSASALNSAYAIDPQLVGTPAPSSAADGDVDSDEEHEMDNDEDEEEPILVPIKVGGKGKGRRGTLQSGGVVKKSATGPSTVFGSLSNGESKLNSGGGKGGKATKSEKGDDDGFADDWRPSPEEYQKMSSKEKRQLRNKISARNFRVRRKGTHFS